MRNEIGLVSTFLLLGGLSVQAVPAPAKDPIAQTCAYLNQNRDEDTATTQATYNPATQSLNIKVTRSVPGMFWPIAESMTKDRANKILKECPNINSVKIDFKSGQSMVVKRAK
jgi:hypothetical protein